LQRQGHRSPHLIDFSFGVVLARRHSMPIDPSEYNSLTRSILAAAIEVHRTLGPGLLESIYFECLQFELTAHGLHYVAHRVVTVVYKDTPLKARYQVDLIVENLVVVEVKSVSTLLPVHQGQTLTYMQLTDCPVGLLINFNVPRLMEGVKRLLNPRASCGQGE
jgi:GxxExxY protein